MSGEAGFPQGFFPDAPADAEQAASTVITDETPVFMPDVKADVILLCYQAEIGRQYLRSHRDEKKN